MTGTCLLLPGMLCDAELFDGQQAALAEILPTAVVPWHGHSLEAMTDLLHATSGGPLHLVGLSLGAIVAMAYAVEHPERVASLALLSTNSAAPTALQRDTWARLQVSIAGGDFDDAVTALLPAMLDVRRRPDLEQRVRNMAVRVGPVTLTAQLRAQTGRPALTERLGRVACPTLVVSGELDTTCPPSFHDTIARAVPGARRETVAGAGHLATLETPQQLRTLLCSWLREVVTATDVPAARSVDERVSS